MLGTVRPTRVEVENLRDGVDARICAAAAMNAYGLFENLCQPLFDIVLNAIAMHLTLPPAKIGAIIGTYTAPAPNFGIGSGG